MRHLVLFLLATSFISSTAFAQADQAAPRTAELAMDESSGRDVRSNANKWIIPPDGSGSVGGSLTFLTADFGPSTGRIRFTDLVFFGLNARYSVGGVAEIYGGTNLLPKQPSFTDELVWQSATLGFRIGLTEWLAASLTGAGGATLDADGAWGGGQAGLDARFALHDFVQLDLGLFGTGTAFFIDEQTPWFTEVLSNLQLAFLGGRGTGGAWVGFDLAFPVADDVVDATTRANFHVGGVLSFIDDWDIYAKYSFIDRGDIQEPQTLLPVLASGFDQQQISFGLSYRFTPDSDE